jgi:hypothetical protein
MRYRHNRMNAALALLVAVFLTKPIAAKDQVPFKARISGTSTYTFLSPTEVLEEFSGTGQGAHLGRFDAEQSHTVDLATTEVLGGTFTFTAANGETVFGTYSGRGAPLSAVLVLFEGTFTIEGGTGRFSDATGEGDMFGLIDISDFPASGTADLTLDGTISSPGTNRKE